MRKIFKKALAGTLSAALVAALFLGADVNKTTVKADDGVLSTWNVFQSGTAPASWGDYEDSHFNSITFTNGQAAGALETATVNAAGDVIGGVTNTGITADGFTADIASNGWQADYDNSANNPWSLRIYMDNIKLTEGHDYKVTFTYTASSQKYINFSLTNAYSETKAAETLIATTAEQTYTLDYGCYYPETATSIQFMLGAFPIADGVVTTTTTEVNWAGQVTIKDIKFTDLGLNSEYETQPAKPSVNPVPETTTKSSGQQTTPKPTTPVKKKQLTKVKKLKAVNKKKGTVKLTWKKVSKAKKYQIKVGKKTYTSKKTTKTIKKLKKGKKYTFKVRATATGYKASAWVKKTIKIKK